MFPRQVDERSRPIDDQRLPDARWGRSEIAAGLVFFIAVALRLPSCFESFWLDELHSAWSVWGSLGEVMPRAAAGNQTPVYFWGLWLWKQIAGESEVALRLPSVFASSLAAAIVTRGIGRHRGNVVAATVGGLLLAVDANSLFYGTELRPFAFVMLLGAVACYVATSDSMKHGRKLLWLILIVIASGLLQPTSIGVLGWFVVAQFLWLKWHQGESLASSYKIRWYGWVALACSLPAFCWLAGGVLREAWAHRQQWQSMGEADSLRQLATIWPWVAFAVVPTCLACGGRLFSKRTSHVSTSHASTSLPWWCLILVAVLATLTFWTVSALGVAPVFHRRYFIACLPILAWVAGDALASLGGFKVPAYGSLAISFRAGFVILLTSVPLLVLLSNQGTVRKLFAARTSLVDRGEGWREAVAWLNRHVSSDSVVYLNPGLIESTRLLHKDGDDNAAYAQWYLTNPLQGPYRWPRVVAFDRTTRQRPGLPIVIRGTRETAESWLRHVSDGKSERKAVIQSFGNVQLIQNGSSELPTSQY